MSNRVYEAAIDYAATNEAVLQKPPSRLSSRMRTAVQQIIINTTTFSTITAGSGLLVDGDPWQVPDVAGNIISEALPFCDPINGQTVEAMADNMTANFVDNATDPLLYNNDQDLLADPSLPAMADKYGLHLANDALKTYSEIYRADNPEAALEQVNTYMGQEYGIAVTSENLGQRTLEDAAKLVVAFYPLPKELVQSVAATDLEEIELNSTAPDKYGDTTVAVYQPADNRIGISSGQTSSTGHEFTHALAKANSRQHCLFRSSAAQENFTNINPAGFTYGENNTGWENVTFDAYAAQAEENVGEDIAVTGAALLHTGLEPSEGNPYNQSEILNYKLAIVAAMAEEMAPGSGRYLSERLATITDPAA